MMNNLLSVTLSQKDKIILVIIFLIFFLLVLLFGIFNRLLHERMKKVAKQIDPIMKGYVKYQFTNNSKDFKKVAYEKNRILFFKQTNFPMLIIAISIISFAIYCSVSKTDWRYIFIVYDDMIPVFEAPTTQIFGMTIWSEVPHIVEGSTKFHNDLNGFVAYIFLTSMTFGLLIYISALINKISREKRIRTMAKSLFEVTLENNDYF